MTALAPLLEALREARRCLSSASTHHGTAVRGCKKCSEASAAVSGIDRALDAFARRGRLSDGDMFEVLSQASRDVADVYLSPEETVGILDAIEVHLLGPREAGPAKAPEAPKCRVCGGLRGRLLGHLTDSNPPPVWAHCGVCKGTGVDPLSGAAGPAKEGGTE